MLSGTSSLAEHPCNLYRTLALKKPPPEDPSFWHELSGLLRPSVTMCIQSGGLSTEPLVYRGRLASRSLLQNRDHCHESAMSSIKGFVCFMPRASNRTT